MIARKAGAFKKKYSSFRFHLNQDGNVLIIIMSIVNLLATIGILVVIYLSFQRDKSHSSVEDIAAQTINDAEGKKREGKDKDSRSDSKDFDGKIDDKKRAMDFGKMVTLEQFTVNLSTPGSVNPKYVKVNISLEVPTDDSEVEVNSKMPQIRNAIIDLFNSKRASDLATADGREYLKEEIRNALNNFLINGKIKGVFFTNFALAG